MTGFGTTSWGVEHLTVDERHYLALQAGIDQFGGNNDKDPIIAAYHMWIDEFGQESADQRFEDSARRLLRNIFNPGLFENPYLDPVESTAIVGNDQFMAEGYDAQVKSVVMLKDTNGAIVPAAEDEKETVYLAKNANGRYSMSEDIVSKYYNITDDPAEADFAIVAMSAPSGGSGYDRNDVTAGGNGYVPIISTVAGGENGEVFNINADVAAARIAAKLDAIKLILMTDIRGLLRDKDDEDTLIPVVNVSEVPSLKNQGIISGGMIPKIDCCVEAVRRGVNRAHILDGRIPHSILIELFSDEGIGTMLY